MNPKAEEFVLDVRRAARTEGKPIVTTDSQLINAEYIARAYERAMVWLTPKIVEVYDPLAFGEWPENLQAELKAAVERFRAVASTVPADKPATDSQAHDGVLAFTKLKGVVREVVLSEWIPQTRGLIDHVEVWARGLDWRTRREKKNLNEFLLGEYTLDQIYLYTEDYLYILAPVARFIPGGLGAFDLSIQPSFNVTSIYRQMDGEWQIHLDIGHGVRGATKKPISAVTLERAVKELRALL